mmetsp:Transcript_23752/g.38845  ORF Transcript_23752/g.38845 Transcript_23752/m.38845 type:complete len:104 (+) Transcript_23752:218-529(+)
MEEAAREAAGKAKKAQQFQANRVTSNKHYNALTPEKKDAFQEQKSKANKGNFDITDCMDHEEITHGKMRISLAKEHTLRMMMGDDTLSMMISKKGVKSVKSNG